MDDVMSTPPCIGRESALNTVAPHAAVAAAQLSACHALALFHRTCPAVLIVPIAASFGMDVDEAASLSIVFFCVYAMLQLPSGALADRFGSLRLACAGCIVTGFGALAFAVASELWLAVASRALIGAGCAVTFVAMVRHVKAHWPTGRVATITGRGILMGNVGAIMSSAPLAFLLVFIDWRTLLLCLGLLSFALAIGLCAYARKAGVPGYARGGLKAFLAELHCVSLTRHNQYAFVVLAGLAGTYWAFVGLWALPLLQEHGVPHSTAVWQVCGMIAAYAIGASVLGAIGDRLNQREATLSASCVGALLCWVLLASGVAAGAAQLTVLLGILGFFCGGFNLVFALVTERNPLEHAGTATAFVNVGTFSGAALLQWLAAVAGANGCPAAGFLVMTGAAGVALVMSTLLWRARSSQAPTVRWPYGVQTHQAATAGSAEVRAT